MRQDRFDRFFERNDKEALVRDIEFANEYNDDHCRISIEVIPNDDDYEYGYGRSVDFSYDTPDEFSEKVKDDILGRYKLEDIVNIKLYLDYWCDEDPYDVFVAEIDSAV